MSEEECEVQIEELEGSQVEFEVTVPEGRVSEVRQEVMEDLKDEVDEPGFRQGNVPDGIIEKKYGPQLKQSVAERLLPVACRQAYRQGELEPVAEPQVKDFDLEDEFYVKAEVDVQPEVNVEPEDYQDMELTTKDWSVTKEDVDDELEELRTKGGQLQPIPITRPVEDGDYVKVDLQGYDENNNPIPGTGEDGSVLEIGSETFLPEVEEGLIGAQIGENRRIQASFPEDFIDDDLAGESVWFEAEVQEIQEQQAPDLEDEEFLEERGVDSVEQLREKIRGNLLDVAEDNRQQALSNQVYENLLEKVKLEIPEQMLENEKEHILENFEKRLETQGQSLDDYLKKQGQKREDMLEEVEPEAKRRIKLTLIFQAIADEEDIEVTEEEFNEYLASWLEGMDAELSPEEFLEQNDDESTVRNLRYQKRDEKVLDYLIEQADVKIEEEDADAEDDSDESSIITEV